MQVQATAASRSPTVSLKPNGESWESRVGYSTLADDWANDIEDIYVTDLDLRFLGQQIDVFKVSLSSQGEEGNGPSIVPTLSRGGEYVAFASEASNLVLGDTNGDRDVFLRSLSRGVTRRSSVNSNGEQVNGTGVESTAPDVTADGAVVVFESDQTQLVDGDGNGVRDVFRRYDPWLEDFRRGDADDNGAVNITDAEFILNYLFWGGEEPGCLDAADANDDGRVDMTDPIYLLDFLFRGGPAPPPPFERCGTDPTADTVTCNEFAHC